ncbi:sulfurtransferase [Subtercola frigoramans]|uniref:Thiosulfate/3-mercaptopyruvate sulfurtransferase n=1 Tax=Subtercola frigoramans TaxID=120298 RepID=A0ABS2L3B4_9MICO|nr:rhodanese-like domain-containing protein [Subtercola frigoramans]MBM7471596.1 thiosulfate/3-mercaptopyruvate sulfurtransferase [Subtercola frigoramans]
MTFPAAPTQTLPGSGSPIVATPTVSTQWLCDHLGGESLVVLDASVLSAQGPGGLPLWLSGRGDFLDAGHIPSAEFADLIDDFSDPGAPFAFTKPTAAQFETAAATVGVRASSRVVVYDSGRGQWAARVWWLFRSFGFDNISVLDGGFTKWTAEDRPTATGFAEPVPAPPVLTEPAPAEFRARELPGFWVDKTLVESIVSRQTDALLICAVSPREFEGHTGNCSRLGHIPGSSSLPSAQVINSETNTLLKPDALRAVFAPVLAGRSTPMQSIVVYCAGGIAAALDALALAVIGETSVALYDGSLNEWADDPKAVLV